MTLGAGMANAISGLTARSRGTALVANNVANVDTPGYSRREVIENSSAIGGVRVDGIERIVNQALLIEKRQFEASSANIAVQSGFFKKIERVVGNPGVPGGLKEAVTTFHASLVSAAENPHTESELIQVASSAKAITTKLREASKAVQAERSKADAAIAKDVTTVNKALKNIVRLNRVIAVTTNGGDDASTHMDQRQAAIDEINSIIPVQVVQRSYNRVAVFTSQGAPLVDGTVPVELQFNDRGHLNANMSQKDGDLGLLIVNGDELNSYRMEAFSGGRLAANFKIRDELGPDVQEELDVLALDLHLRFKNQVTNPVLGEGANALSSNRQGLFVYEEPVVNDAYTNYNGLASRISLNNSVDPEGNVQSFWRLRNGLHTNTSEEDNLKGETRQLNNFQAALTVNSESPNNEVFSGEESFIDRLADFESRVAGYRVNFDEEMAKSNSQLSVVTQNFLADGVDLDRETHKLLQLEQSYRANAKVIKAIDDMLAEILRW